MPWTVKAPADCAPKEAKRREVKEGEFEQEP